MSSFWNRPLRATSFCLLESQQGRCWFFFICFHCLTLSKGRKKVLQDCLPQSFLESHDNHNTWKSEKLSKGETPSHGVQFRTFDSLESGESKRSPGGDFLHEILIFEKMEHIGTLQEESENWDNDHWILLRIPPWFLEEKKWADSILLTDVSL